MTEGVRTAETSLAPPVHTLHTLRAPLTLNPPVHLNNAALSSLRLNPLLFASCVFILRNRPLSKLTRLVVFPLVFAAAMMDDGPFDLCPHTI